MKYGIRRMLALILSLCMIAGMTGLPITAYAEGPDSGDSDAAIVVADKDALAIGYSGSDGANNVTADLTLPVTGASGSAIAWLSDTLEVIANDGAVTRPAADAGDVEVTLTATITSGEASDTKEFTVTVLACQGEKTGFEPLFDLTLEDGTFYELEMEACTATTITIKAIDGAQYRARDFLRGIETPWQDSNVITGLQANRPYSITARWKETSEIFTSAFVRTDKAGLSGSVYVEGYHVFGQTLEADISRLKTIPEGLELGDFSYQWTRSGEGIMWATESTYTLVAADIGHKVTVKVTAENCYGQITGATSGLPVEKASQAKPPVPSAASKTATSITLNATEGAEYRGAGRDWQDSPTFPGLTPDTTYTFFVRMKESATHKESDTAFGPLTTEKAALVGTVSVSGSHVYGETLTAVTGAFSTDPAGYDTGEISCQWTRDGADIAGAAGTSYTLTAEDVGRVINIRVTAANCQSPIASDNTSAVAKATQDTLSPPILDFAEDTSITLGDITGAEYKRGEGEWQDSRTFTGLTPSTEYTFYARMKETATHYASASSGPRVLQTLKAAQPAPEPPTVSLVSVTDVKFVQITNAQYRKGDEAWKDIGSFGGLQPNTTYTFYMRMKETTTHQASPPSAPVTVTTLKRTQHAVPAAPTLLSKTATGITLNSIAGAEYSKDGAIWQDSPVFSGLTPDTGYTFYARLKETSEYYASSPSEASGMITTDKAALSGSVSISGSHVFGQELTAVTSALIIEPADAVIGTLSFQWMRDGAEIAGATASAYTLVAADVGKVINVKVSSEYCTGEVISTNSSAVARAGQAAPAAPTPVSVTATGVTLTAIPGAQYFCGTTALTPEKTADGWQSSPEFTGLSPNTTYYFFAYLEETGTHLASPVSTGAAATTEKAPMTGTASITGTLKYGETLTVNITGITGTFTCTWYRSGDSVPINVGMGHLIGVIDVGKTITVQVTEADHDGFIADTTGVVAKADGPAAPTGGVIDDTADIFGFMPVPGYAAAALYEYSTDGGTSWNDISANPFSVGDTAIAAGALQVRLKETYTHLAGAVLASTAAFTENLTGSVAISGPAVYGETLTATATGTQGDASPVCTWYRSGESASIHTGSTYQVIQADIGRTLRAEATAAGYGGKLVSADTAVVAKAVQAPPTLAYTRSGDYETTGVTVTITSPAGGAAYSFDGVTYSAASSHTYAQGVTGAMIYARLEETATHLQSAAASLTLDFTKQNQSAPTVTLSATAGEASIMLHISASGGQSGSYSYKIDGGSYADLPADGNAALTMAGETVVVSARDKGDAYYNPSPDASQTIALPKYLNSATVTVSAANFTKTKNSIIMSVTPVSSNDGDMEYSFDGGAYVTLDTNDLPAFTGLAAGSSHTVSLRVKGDAQREAGAPASVTIQTLVAGSTGGGNSGGDTSEPPKPAVAIEKQPNMPVTAKISVAGTVKDGILSATITEQMVKDAISAAQESARKSGKAADGIAVEFGITNSGNYTSMSAAIDAGAIDRLKEAGVKFIKIGSALLDVTLDTGAIAETDRQSTGTVTVSARAQTKLSKAAQALIGSRPVFDITVSYQKGGKTGYVTSFGKGAVTLGIAYKAPDKEKTGSLFGVFVDKNGKPQLLANSSYVGGRVIFSRDSLSTYGVGYKTPVPAFTDTAEHWAKENIDFAASRGLISGASATTFAPNTAITRADFLVALGRLSGADVSAYKTSSFSDVKTGDPAMPYIEWAVKNKIVQGIGGGRFGPALSISRQDMAVMMQNYAKTTGYKLPVSIAAVTFSDSAKIAAYAKEAVTAIQQAGVMQGKGNNAFDPQGNATRAEASAILRRFVELVIDEGTARGWSRNDAGQWLYIGENGKAVTGWLTEGDAKYYSTGNGLMVSGKWLQIDGKWYYFYADGSLARDTKIDGYEVDENGVRKTE
jgi:hypothetical protein